MTRLAPMTSPIPPPGNRSASATPISTKLRQATERVNFLWISTLNTLTSRLANASSSRAMVTSDTAENAASRGPAGRGVESLAGAWAWAGRGSSRRPMERSTFRQVPQLGRTASGGDGVSGTP